MARARSRGAARARTRGIVRPLPITAGPPPTPPPCPTFDPPSHLAPVPHPQPLQHFPPSSSSSVPHPQPHLHSAPPPRPLPCQSAGPPCDAPPDQLTHHPTSTDARPLLSPGALPLRADVPVRDPRVRPNFTFRDALLSNSRAPLLPRPAALNSRAPRLRPPLLDTARARSLPDDPPRYLLNKSLVGRCFRCFLRGHRAAACRGPRRCLLCMCPGHPASKCRAPAPQRSRASAAPEVCPDSPPEVRPSNALAFIPARPPPKGLPCLAGRIAKVAAVGASPAFIREALPRRLAGAFGGVHSDYRVASVGVSSTAIIFPSWASRESAIGRSPLRFDDVAFSFSDWSELGEGPRGRLRHKAWIRLLNWPVLCWHEEDVQAAVAGFGELWEVDPASSELRDLSCFRVQVRCQHVRIIPKRLTLMVEDRRFIIPVVVDSWEETCPILLGEVTDRRLGLDTAEEQDRFTPTSGFRRVPAAECPLRASGSHSPPRFSLVPDDFPCLAPAPALQSTSADSVCSPVGFIPATLPAPTGLADCVSSPATGTAVSPGPAPADSARPPQVCTTATPAFSAASLNFVETPPSLPATDLGPSPGHCLPPPTLEFDRRNKNCALDRADSRNIVASRRSVRLAAKCRGGKKMSSLSRAQDLMCRKLKMVRLTARASRSNSLSVSSSSSLPAPRPRDLSPRLTAPRAPIIEGLADQRGESVVPPPTKDLLAPLSSPEIRAIKLACGIIDAGLDSSLPNGGIAGGT